jgi:hypothetical protein
METSLTIEEIQRLKLELEKSIAQLFADFSTQTKLRVIEVRPHPNDSGVPGLYQPKVLTNYPFQ